jgi:hypothetical protein
MKAKFNKLIILMILAIMTIILVSAGREVTGNCQISYWSRNVMEGAEVYRQIHCSYFGEEAIHDFNQVKLIAHYEFQWIDMTNFKSQKQVIALLSK